MRPVVPTISFTLLAVCGTAFLMHAKKNGDDPNLSRAENAKRRAVAKLKPHLDQANLKLGSEIFIRIFKETSELEVYLKATDTKTFKLLKNYKICTYSGTLGPKQRQGDHQAPEGCYSVRRSAMNPQSRFHLSFNLGYPNAYDRAHKRTGDFLMVHGDCVSIGCYAMTDPGIEEIYTLADASLTNGQKFFRVHCFPFRMTAGRMAKAEKENSPWLPFWKNLKEAYDHFEKDKLPPDAEVEGKKYKFASGSGD